MDRLIEIIRPRDRGIDPMERNPMPTHCNHGFNFQTARLIAATKVIHKKYGTKMSAAAAVILVPYFLWVTFAAAINLAVWRLNP